MTGYDTALEKHPRLYFLDGDVVLAAKRLASAAEPPRLQLFRVHKPILRHHSTVFANMFGDATPGETFEDAPMVKLARDDADGFASLLTFLYYPAEAHFDRWNANTPLTISPALRLANKYLIESLRDHLIKTVVRDWPLTLHDWDRHQAEMCALSNLSPSMFLLTSGERGGWSTRYGPKVPEPATAIRFALEYGCPEILPAAFYTLSRIGIEQDWANGGCDRWARPARWSILQGRDFVMLLRGAKAIRDYCGRASNPYGMMWKILSKRCRPHHDFMFDEMDDLNSVEEYPCYAVVRKIFTRVWRITDHPDPLLSWKLCMEYKSIEGLAEELSPEKLCLMGPAARSYIVQESVSQPAVKTPAQVLLAGPITPPSSKSVPIPPSTAILISEEAPSGWFTLYRGHVSSTGSDARALEETMPLWLLECLLQNKAPAIPITKMSFVLLPYREPDGEQLPELLNTQQSKLTASRFLRVRKLTLHVQDKLEKLAGGGSPVSIVATPRSSFERRSLSSVQAHDSRPRPEEQYEILCNDVVLPLDITLAAVRQYVWRRQSAELVMHYRRKPGSMVAGAVHA